MLQVLSYAAVRLFTNMPAQRRREQDWHHAGLLNNTSVTTRASDKIVSYPAELVGSGIHIGLSTPTIQNCVKLAAEMLVEAPATSAMSNPSKISCQTVWDRD